MLLLLLLLPWGDDGERSLPPDHHCRIILQEARVEDGGAGGPSDRGEHVDSSAAGGGDAQLDEEEEEDDGEGLKEPLLSNLSGGSDLPRYGGVCGWVGVEALVHITQSTSLVVLDITNSRRPAWERRHYRRLHQMFATDKSINTLMKPIIRIARCAVLPVDRAIRLDASCPDCPTREN